MEWEVKADVEGQDKYGLWASYVKRGKCLTGGCWGELLLFFWARKLNC